MARSDTLYLCLNDYALFMYDVIGNVGLRVRGRFLIEVALTVQNKPGNTADTNRYIISSVV